jgi:hypothetical protein
MRTERCFSSSGLLEMLPMYQLRLTTLGVHGQVQGMNSNTPVFCGTHREYVVSTMYVNVVCMAVIVQMLFL